MLRDEHRTAMSTTAIRCCANHATRIAANVIGLPLLRAARCTTKNKRNRECIEQARRTSHGTVAAQHAFAQPSITALGSRGIIDFIPSKTRTKRNKTETADEKNSLLLINATFSLPPNSAATHLARKYAALLMMLI